MWRLLGQDQAVLLRSDASCSALNQHAMKVEDTLLGVKPQWLTFIVLAHPVAERETSVIRGSVGAFDAIKTTTC